ncbi:prolipoprotein diacylglyceryl transferase [Candidatus Rhodobacter oscarellae]|uniref:prolipoprotein diacylglyceryl transferase n=1 Tax=Candidatus Rhodobacter oscarellae TaxID=1675527 RepID=UPI0006717854|nr:prolipoprotein diacylglyceryl transferase [Candidatus Rhodobacter lobularis]
MPAAIPFPDVSPEIFSIGGFALRWYALAYIVGILIGWRIAVAAVTRPAIWTGDPVMTPKQVEDLLTGIILGVILGGRIGYVLFYQPGYYLQNPGEILAVWQGGMAFHGGFIGVGVAIVLFSWRNKLHVGSVADVLALATAPALLLGRVSNFVNAELWGRPSDAPWAVIFPGQAAQDCAGILPGLCARHPSQLYEAALEGIVLGALLLYLAFRRGAFKTPWLLTALFFAGYGVARFIVEFFRQADAQFITAENPWGHVIAIGPAGITMGQLLSLPMIIIGVALFVWARRRA